MVGFHCTDNKNNYLNNLEALRPSLILRTLPYRYNNNRGELCNLRLGCTRVDLPGDYM
jgi:hypothetical protein